MSTDHNTAIASNEGTGASMGPPMNVQENPYRTRPLLDLAVLVSERRDAGALAALLSRPLFAWDKRRVTLPEYLRLYTGERLDRNLDQHAIIEAAQDIAKERFSLLPESPGRGTDCAKYYRAFVEACRREIPGDTPPLEREEASVDLLRIHMRVHFKNGLLEARRMSNPHIQRYHWKTRGGGLSLYMPRAMDGKTKRAWLEQLLKEQGPQLLEIPGMVQQIVDERLNNGAADRHTADLTAYMEGTIDYESGEDIDQAFSQRGIADTLAREKAEKIDTLSAPIQALGKEKLQSLIRSVLAGHETGGFNEGEMAKAHGLSAATFSRFCGGRWIERAAKGNSPKGKLPVLWENLATLCARSLLFLLVVLEAGPCGKEYFNGNTWEGGTDS